MAVGAIVFFIYYFLFIYDIRSELFLLGRENIIIGIELFLFSAYNRSSLNLA